MSILKTQLDQHDAILLDAMGVLIDKNGAITGARALIEHLNNCGKSYFVLTNICSNTEEGIYHRLQCAGIPLASPDQVISAGSLVRCYLMDYIPPGATVAFIGPSTCRSIIDSGVHTTTTCLEIEQFDVLVILDDEGFAFRETLEAALTSCVRTFEKSGRLPVILLANSDRAYPVGAERFAFGSGIFPVMLCDSLQKLLNNAPEVILFGKPSARMFEEARRRGGSGPMMMIGDQISTDILGANRAGVTSVLVETGLNVNSHATGADAQPNHVLKTLSLGDASH